MIRARMQSLPPGEPGGTGPGSGRRGRRAAFALVLALALGLAVSSAPAAPPVGLPCRELDETGLLALRLLGGDEDQGIGGTGRSGNERGIGGTGRAGEERGIGGTGRSEDLRRRRIGLYGTITQLGSLCINGLRIHLAESTPVELNGAPADPDRLAAGQVVWVEAGLEAGRLAARRVEVWSALRGPLEAVDEAGRRMRVAGRSVDVPSDAVLVDDEGHVLESLGALGPGDLLEVYGLAHPMGLLVASRVERLRSAPAPLGPAPPLAELMEAGPALQAVLIEGYLERAPSGLAVAGLELDLASTPPEASELLPGGRVWLAARPETGGRLRVLELVPRPPPAEPLPPPSAVHETPAGRPAPSKSPTAPESAPPARDRPGAQPPRQLEPGLLGAHDALFKPRSPAEGGLHAPGPRDPVPSDEGSHAPPSREPIRVPQPLPPDPLLEPTAPLEPIRVPQLTPDLEPTAPLEPITSEPRLDVAPSDRP
ncbi:MAG: DUF5666 domain-containing protein [Myxococcota bacterium]